MTTALDQLSRYAATQDADAFAHLVRAHADLVYSACLRILSNPADAQDAAQDVFLSLARNAGRIRTSPAAWLHRCATNHCLNLRRSAAARAARERAAAADRQPASAPGDSWSELAPAVDAAIDALPDEQRELLVAHFLRQVPQQRLAEDLSVSPATVSRRLADAVEELRSSLAKAGVSLAAAALGALLSERSLAAAPSALVAAVTKIGLAGAGPVAIGATLGSVKWLVAAALAAAALVVVLMLPTTPKGPLAMTTPAGSTPPASPTPAPASAAATPPDPIEITNLPGKGGNGHIRGMEIILGHMGTPVDYDRLMALSGVAFIAQADSAHIWQGKVDVGWWPLDVWGPLSRMDFLSQALPWKLRYLGVDDEEAAKKDLLAYYRKHFEADVLASLRARRPVLATDDFGFIIAGINGEGFPIGYPPAAKPGHKMGTCHNDPPVPWGMFLLDAPNPAPLSRDEADLAALQHASDLANDRARVPSRDDTTGQKLYAGCYLVSPTGTIKAPTHSSGQKSYAAWARVLRDPNEPTESRYHANMLNHVRGNRQSAIVFLRDLATRRPAAAAALSAAADEFQKLVDETRQMSTRGLQESQDLRAVFAGQVEALAALDARGFAQIDAALAILKPSRALTVRREGGLVYLSPIPRFPRRIDRLDAAAKVVASEDEPAWHDHIPGALHVAMKMQGHDLPWPQVFAATGHPFRCAFEPTWTHDTEFATPIDELATACETLGFASTALQNKPLAETLAAIDTAIEGGRPVLTGLSPRFWCIIVGIDTQKREYLTIGGPPFEGWPRRKARPGELVADTFDPADCLRRPIPQQDFIAGRLAPDQVARNPIFILGDRKNVPARDTIQRTLRTAIDLGKPRTMDRPNLDLHRAMPRNSGFPNTPRAGSFQLGNDGIRAWADAMAQRTEPTHDFHFIHAIDTSLGMQLRAAEDAAKYLQWAAAQLDEPARGHVAAAAKLYADSTSDKAVLCGYNGYLPDSLDARALLKFMEANPAISYIASEEQQGVLEAMGFACKRCPWGISVLPDKQAFVVARDRAVARLRQIADQRDAAAAEMAKALAR